MTTALASEVTGIGELVAVCREGHLATMRCIGNFASVEALADAQWGGVFVRGVKLPGGAAAHQLVLTWPRETTYNLTYSAPGILDTIRLDQPALGGEATLESVAFGPAVGAELEALAQTSLAKAAVSSHFDVEVLA